MAYKGVESLSFGEDLSINHDSDSPHIISDYNQVIDINDISYIQDSAFMRDGGDLVLDGPNGTLIIEGYFTAEIAPSLHGPEGQVLSPQLVDSFLQSGNEYAQNSTMSDESPVGTIQELSGEATITRADGASEALTLGTPIFEGDVIETGANGALNISFADDSSFAISGNSKMAIDEFVFDSGTQSGVSDFSMLKGMFVYISGMIGREDPDDVQIDTPVGSIGIRGTTIAGNVDTGEITVVEGAIVLRDFQGNEMTLASQFETATFDATGGSIVNNGALSPTQMIERYSSISSISPDLFTSIEEQAREQQREEKTEDQEGSDDQDAEAPQDEGGNDGEEDGAILLDDSGLPGSEDALLELNENGFNLTKLASFDKSFEFEIEEDQEISIFTNEMNSEYDIPYAENIVDNITFNGNNNSFFFDDNSSPVSIAGSNNSTYTFDDIAFDVTIGSPSSNNIFNFGDIIAGMNRITVNDGAEFNTINGGSGVEMFILNEGAVRAYGNGGEDIFALFQNAIDELQNNVNGTFTNAILDGGSGSDTILLHSSVSSIDFTAIAAAGNEIRNIEKIDASAASDQTITLGYDDVVNMTDADNELIIELESGDVLDLTDAGFDTQNLVDSGADIMIDGLSYHVFTADGGVTIYIHDDGGGATVNT